MANANKNCSKGNRKTGKPNNDRRNAGRKRESQDYQKERTFDEKKATNDPAWYATTPELLRDAGRIPFSWSVGTPIRSNSLTLNNYTVPGILAFETAPAFGWADSQTDPLNIASFELYSYVRHANSGSANYDAPDLMLYIMAVSQAVSYIEFLKRVYGVARVYSQRNRYLPQALVAAMNVDFDDVLKNIANFRYGINVLINKLASFAAPSDLTLFKRQAFMYSQIYTEGTSIKDQLYLYTPKGFGRFITTGTKFSDAPAGALMYFPFDPGVLDTIVYDQNTPPVLTKKAFSVDNLLRYGEALMQPLLESEDLNIMSGDILKAYGAQNIFSYAFLDENYAVTPTFDIAVLEQMKNAKFYRPAIFNSNDKGASIAYRVYDDAIDAEAEDKKWWPLLVYQDLASQNYGNLHSEWGFCGNPSTHTYKTFVEVMSHEQLMTTTTAEVTPELVMESSRMLTAAVPEINADISSTAQFTPIYCGSDIVVDLKIYTYIYDRNTRTLKLTHDDAANGVIATSGDPGAVYNNVCGRLSKAKQFDFFPEMQVVSGCTPTSVGTLVGICFDLDNYAVLTPADIERLHEAALLSMLHVNSIARV